MKNTANIARDTRFLNRWPDVRVVSGAPQKQAEDACGTQPAYSAQEVRFGTSSPNGKHNCVTVARGPRGRYLRRHELDAALAIAPVLPGHRLKQRTVAALVGTGKSTIARIEKRAMAKLWRRNPQVAAWLEGRA